MHKLNCLVAIAGDVHNKTPKEGITTAELQVLRAIHGQDSCTDIDVIGNPRVTQTEERERLMWAYRNHHELINDLWRDGGGKFESDIRNLKLHPNFFRPPPTAPYDGIDEPEAKVDSEKSEIAI